MLPQTWDYLVLTAGSEAQASAYRRQLAARRELGLLHGARQILVVADPQGRRIGNGGSTIHGLLAILNGELSSRPALAARPETWTDVFRGLRILMIHAGGDSRRLPAYGACGKVFMPVPVPGDSTLDHTLFDVQWPVYRRLPAAAEDAGQVVVCAGDVLVDLRPEQVDFMHAGVTGLGWKAPPSQGTRHGVYCLGPRGRVRRFLQKPSLAQQQEAGAIDGYDRCILDVGVIHFDASVAAVLLALAGTAPRKDGTLAWNGPLAETILDRGLDFYREVLCALGGDTGLEQYCQTIRAGGSSWDEAPSAALFGALSGVPFHAQVLDDCRFWHFDTPREIIRSGQALIHRGTPVPLERPCVSINNRLAEGVELPAADAWVEGCELQAPVVLQGDNLLVGADIAAPLCLPPHACLDIVPGHNREGEPKHFVRCYFDSDLASGAADQGATLCAHPLTSWLGASGARLSEVWDGSLATDDCGLWNARLFPAEAEPDGYRRWLWMFAPRSATAEQFAAWRQADRYSLEEIALLGDDQRFHSRRLRIREAAIRASLRRRFLPESRLSAADLALLLARTDAAEEWVGALMAEARWHWQRRGSEPAEEAFIFPRIAHSLGTAVLGWARDPSLPLERFLPRLANAWEETDRQWLAEVDLLPRAAESVADWTSRLRRAAFQYMRSRIVSSGAAEAPPPRNALRSDEIVWGRAPARLDLAGGWTDTPPFSLEHGGQVLNAAVELNGQSPIHVYARVVPDLVFRFRSIDRGTQQEVRDWEELSDYHDAVGEFSLAKAALAIAGFAPPRQAPSHQAPPSRSLADTLRAFGGGLELTTLAAIPKGSGLGTSSIIGAVLLATIHRVCGCRLSPNDLFHAVLRLEQVMTTGGGWQDQVGGAVAGLKLVAARSGLIPDTTLRYVPADILDPRRNGGQTLLYYTGVTRLAKNILQQVVGRWLDRDREAAATLEEIGRLAHDMTEAVSRQDVPEFGRLIDSAWQLNQRLDPNSTTPEIDAMLERLRPHIHGAKLLGAGGGGFLFLVCRSPGDAESVRALLNAAPPNPLARFFDFAVAERGLEVSVC